MAEHFPLMLPGSPVGELNVISPFAGEQLATVALCGADNVEQALHKAYQLYRNRKAWLTTPQRIKILEKLASLMTDQADQLAVGAASEGGKPLTDSRVEVARAIAGIKLCIEQISGDAGSVIPMHETLPNTTRMAFTQKEPIGVVVAVSAFNHPLNLIIHQVGAAVAAGCPVIVKPSEDTPLSCLRFVQLLRDAGLADDWCQVAITNGHDVAEKLITDKRVGFFSFIGSARVGWMLRSKLSAGTRCALEHGGVAPVIVDSNANLDKVVPSLLKGGFYHAGQVCVSVQRVFIHNSLLEELAQRLKDGAEQLVVGNPVNGDTEVGPLIRPGEVDRIDQWVQEAITTGAQLVTGGRRLDNNCYAPTLLLNPPSGSSVSSQEIFGPVVCLYGFEDIEQAIGQANSLDVAFQAAVFTQDIDRAVQIYQQLDASAVMVNDHTAFRVDGMPFAGLKQSGLGVGGIGHTIEDMQVEKMMVIKSPL